jgi:hypothetical protein
MTQDSIVKFSKKYFTQLNRDLTQLKRKVKSFSLDEDYSDEMCVLISRFLKETAELQDRLLNFAWERLPKRRGGNKPYIYFPAFRERDKFIHSMNQSKLDQSAPKCAKLIDYLEGLQEFSDPENSFLFVMRDIGNRKHTDNLSPEPVGSQSIIIGENLGGKILRVEKLEFGGGQMRKFQAGVFDPRTGKYLHPATAIIRTEINLIFKQHNVKAIDLCEWGFKTTQAISVEFNKILSEKSDCQANT